jgi:DNA-binding SARP family transcriptional activator/ABC-type glycerol-3-phosphate transport system substrate-binding protein
VQFSVLGKLEAVVDGEPRRLGAYKQRSLLALLLIEANRVVSTDRILDELWGGDLGGDRQNALWVHVSNLRSALEPDRPRRSEGTVVLTRAPGYLVEVAPEAIDAWRFEALLREGRAMLDADPAAASMAIGEGLALWRGRAYEDFTYESFAHAEIGRLEELRMEAVELRLEADLRRGLAAELVGELDGLVRLNPLRERLTAQLMTALYRSGRRGDALRSYQRLRARLVDELGVDPSSELQRLEAQILAGDADLDRGATVRGRQTRLAVRGYELRDKLGDGAVGAAYRAYQPTVGREVAIRVVRGELADDPGFIRRFEARAEQVARIEHPHLAPLYDYWREPGAAYVVTRLFRGGSLADLLRQGPLDVPQAAQLVSEVGAALAVMHGHGIVHGGVSPANILFDEDRRAYLGEVAVLGDDDEAGSPVPTAQSDVTDLAAVLASALTGRQPVDVTSTLGDLPVGVGDVIRRATTGDPTARPADVDAFTTAVQEALGAPPDDGGVTIANPYKGLRAFDEADATDFFGRERVVERLLARIGDGAGSGRLVALVGPSGSGKSSTVHAGLVPALRGGALPGSAEWFVVDMTPGAHPFEALAAALLRVAVRPAPGLVDQLLGDATGLRRAIDRTLPGDRAELLLVIDQFEELFTQASEAAARAFLDALVTAVLQPPSRVHVVLTLRADFYDRPLAHRAFGELVRRGTEVITPMAPEELERAVSRPLERTGVEIERSLVAEIVADVADRPATLPLLQYALTELFDRRRGGVIELATYRAMGGVSGALVRRAESEHDELDEAGRAAARRILLQLVTIGDGGEIVRRRVLRTDLTAPGDAAVDAVLDRFGARRLLSFDRDPVTRGPTVEIAHEALLVAWHRLRSWIDERRDDIRHQRRLGQHADEWVSAGRDDGYLLRGAPLEQLSAWASTTDLSLTGVEQEYLAVSRDRRDRERQVEDERRRGERHLRRSARRRARLLVGSAAVLALVAALAAYAVVQRGDAERLADDLAAVAEARRLAAASAVAADDDPDLAMLLALRSLDVSARAGIPTLVESEDALHWAIQGGRISYPVTDAPIETRVGPDGLTGVYRLPLAELVGLARDHLRRGFTIDECERYAIEPCPLDDAGLASPAAAGERALPADPPRPSPAEGTTSLAGTRLTIGITSDYEPGVSAELERFEARSGTDVSLLVLTEEELAAGVSQGVPPDLVIWPSTGWMLERGRQGELLDLSPSVDPEQARELVGDYFVDAATSGSTYRWLPVGLDLKGIVWYPAPEFAEAGYTAPTTWAELISLSEQMVADGRTPWCIGLESGDADGWPATDWVEALVLRLGGVDEYDRWVAHEVPFDAPTVAAAAAMFGDIAFREEFVLGGTEAILADDIFGSASSLFEDPPRCWLHHQASFIPYLLGAPDVAIGDVGFFVLPPVDAGGDAPVFGGGALLGAFSDRPEVREFVRWTMTPEWGVQWAAEGNGSFRPASILFDSARCVTDAADARANALRVALCEVIQQAVATDQWRFDASDAMPPAIGGTTHRRGAFLRGMLDYIEQGPGSLDDVLARIESEWAAHPS